MPAVRLPDAVAGVRAKVLLAPAVILLSRARGPRPGPRLQ
jgi:hypothetical protein